MFRGMVLGLALFLLTAPPHLWAGSCAVVAPVKAVATVNTYAAPVAAVAYVPFLPAVTVPSYTVTYVPPPVVAPEPAPVRESIRASDLAEILAEIKALRGEVESLKRSQPVPQQALPQRDTGAYRLPFEIPHPGTEVLVKRCAACHDAAVADDKGGGLALSDRGTPSLSQAAAAKSWQRVSRNQMPPPPTRLAPVEKQQLLAYLREAATRPE